MEKQMIQRWVFAAALYMFAALFTLNASPKPPYLMNQSFTAQAILENAYTYIGKQKSFAFDAVTINDDILQDDVLIELKHIIHIEVDRPGALLVDISGDVKNRTMYLQEGLFTLYNKSHNYYAQIDIPKDLDDALDYIFERYDIKTPLANILYSDIVKRLKPKGIGHYVGSEYVGRVLCDYVVFSNTREEFQVWIEKGDKPLIRKFIIIDKTGKRELRSTTLILWQDPFISSSEHYTFQPLSGAIKIPIEVPEGRRP